MIGFERITEGAIWVALAVASAVPFAVGVAVGWWIWG